MGLTMHGQGGAMQRQRWVRLFVVATACVALPAADAQTPTATRDSGRVYRFQLRRGDTNLVRVIRLTRQQLEGRLDSLQREFEELGLDAPDRIELSRELRTLISSLADLSQVEQNVRARVSSSLAENGGLRKRALIGAAPVFAGQLRNSAMSLQPGWIGLNVEAPHSRMVVRDDSAYIRYFGYPDVISVEPNSPAERAGIMRGDQLIAYDGADLRDREINVTQLFQPSRRLRVTVRRDGDEREFPIIVSRPPPQVIERRKLSAPEAVADSIAETFVFATPSAAPSPPGLRVGRGAVLFNRLDPETAPLAGAQLAGIRGDTFEHLFGVTSGVLVTDVFSDPARSSGLRGGDVIVRADGRELTTVAQLRAIVVAHRSDRMLELEIVRQKKTRPLTLRW
jgi:S1-C subfamily serine protease